MDWRWGVRGARIGGHDQDHVAEIDLLAVGVGENPVVHDLQQDVVDVLVSLLDFVEQHHGVRVLVDGVGQLAALVIADIAWRGADQAAHGMALHVLGHVEADHLDAQSQGQLLGGFGLADAGRAAEQERADRLVRVAKTGAGQLHGRGQLHDRVVLTEHRARFRSVSSSFSASVSDLETDLGGMRAILATTASISLTPRTFLRRFSAAASGPRPPRRSRRSPCRAACGR